jgi:tetratricopeptide (TPR) repeat protein
MSKHAAVVVGSNYQRAPANGANPDGAPVAPNPLRFAEADAQAMADVLKAEGYDVAALIGADATRAQIIRTIQQKRRTLDPDGVFVIHFAGHGMLESDDPNDPDSDSIAYLLPSDVDLTSLAASAIALEDLSVRYLPDHGASVVLLDCCHSGYAIGMRGEGDTRGKAQAFLNRTQQSFTNWGRMVLAACPGDELARELEEMQHGAFTYFLLDHWQHSPEEVNVDELFLSLGDRLKDKNLPHPVMGGSQREPIVLRAARAVAATPAATTAGAPGGTAREATPAPAAATNGATAAAAITPEEAAQRAQVYTTLSGLDDTHWTALLTTLDVQPADLGGSTRPGQIRKLIADWATQGLLTALANEATLAQAAQRADATRQAATLWTQQREAMDQEDWDTAIKLGEQILVLDPDQHSARTETAVALNERGTVHIDAQQLDEALADYTRAFELDPQNETACYNRGNTLYSLERYDEAVAVETQAIQLNPEDADAYNLRGKAHATLEHRDEALTDFSKAIQLNPDFAEAYFNRGCLYQDQLQNYKEAGLDYDAALRLDPEYGDAYVACGDLLYTLERYEDALAAYSQAIELDPQWAPAYKGRSAVYTALGDTRKAHADLARARKLDPGIE